MAIDSVTKLRAVYRRPPRARSGLKVLDRLDVHCRNFIARSPLCVISSSRADGRADASPRGDLPGSLAHVLDDKTLLLPDRPGNRQLDTLTNLVERPYVGLVFFVPGWNETLRINGRAEIVTESELLAPLAIRGKPPLSALKVTVDGGVSALRQGAHPGPALGTGGAGRTLPVPDLRAGAGRPDRGRRRRRDRRRLGAERQDRSLLTPTAPGRTERLYRREWCRRRRRYPEAHGCGSMRRSAPSSSSVSR